jgi:hypothetical protein
VRRRDLDHHRVVGAELRSPFLEGLGGGGTHNAKGMHMKRTSWILGSMTAIALTACGGRQNTAGTPESGAAGAPADTSGMAPAPPPTDTSAGAAGMSDTSMKTSSDTGLKSDTAGMGKSKKTSRDTTLKTGTGKDSAK